MFIPIAHPYTKLPYSYPLSQIKLHIIPQACFLSYMLTMTSLYTVSLKLLAQESTHPLILSSKAKAFPEASAGSFNEFWKSETNGY